MSVRVHSCIPAFLWYSSMVGCKIQEPERPHIISENCNLRYILLQTSVSVSVQVYRYNIVHTLLTECTCIPPYICTVRDCTPTNTFALFMQCTLNSSPVSEVSSLNQQASPSNSAECLPQQSWNATQTLSSPSSSSVRTWRSISRIKYVEHTKLFNMVARHNIL